MSVTRPEERVQGMLALVENEYCWKLAGDWSGFQHRVTSEAKLQGCI